MGKENSEEEMIKFLSLSLDEIRDVGANLPEGKLKDKFKEALLVIRVEETRRDNG